MVTKKHKQIRSPSHPPYFLAPFPKGFSWRFGSKSTRPSDSITSHSYQGHLALVSALSHSSMVLITMLRKIFVFHFFHLGGFSSALQLISLLRKKPTRGRSGYPSGQVLLHDPSQPELLNDGDDPLSPRGVREQPVGLHGKHQSAHQIGHVRHFQSLSGRLEEPLLEKWSCFF